MQGCRRQKCTASTCDLSFLSSPSTSPILTPIDEHEAESNVTRYRYSDSAARGQLRREVTDSTPPLSQGSSPFRYITSQMLRRSQRLAGHLISSLNPAPSATMSSFTLPDTDVPVTLVDDLSKEQLLEFPAFKVALSPRYHRTLY